MSPASSGGGAAAQAGMDYQNRVAAWVAVRILTEQESAPPWDLSSDTTLEFIRCETEQPVDDLLVGTSHQGHIFVQVKHSLNLSSSSDSPFASVIDQFVRQFIAHRGINHKNHPWERPLDSERDRLLLVSSPGSSAPIRQHLPSVLRRLRSLSQDEGISRAVTNEKESDALTRLRECLAHSWNRVTGETLAEGDERELLLLIRVQILDVDQEGSDELEANDLLRRVLRDPTQSQLAWHTIVQACANYASNRRGADRPNLQHLLLQAGIAIKAPPSFRNDIECLQQTTRSTLEALSGLSKIRVGSDEVRITRQSTMELRRAAESLSLVVIGDPGAGKSGALHNLVEQLCGERRDVIFFAVDRFEASSLGNLRNEIGLAHDLNDILENWPGEEVGFLIIDALDAARSDASSKCFRDLISMTLKAPNRWHIIPSIRKFDLRYSPQLHQLFSGQPPSEFRDSQGFGSICHLNVPILEDSELAQIRSQSPQLAELVDQADITLCNLLRIPFNLRLMGDLLGTGATVESLTPIQTQIQLLDRYWQERVIRSDDQGDARESLLRQAANRMVATRSLRVDRSAVSDNAAASEILLDILSANVLTEWQPTPDAQPERYVLTFSHHVLYDYAVARLLLRGTLDTFVDRLENDPDLILAIQPSLVLHFQYIWLRDQSRQAFWHLVLRVIRSSGIPEIGKLIGPRVATEVIKNTADCEPLIAALEDSDEANCQAASQALRHLAGALLASAPDSPSTLIGENAGPWSDLLERVSRL